MLWNDEYEEVDKVLLWVNENSDQHVRLQLHKALMEVPSHTKLKNLPNYRSGDEEYVTMIARETYDTLKYFILMVLFLYAVYYLFGG